jgi:hypothetical protein
MLQETATRAIEVDEIIGEPAIAVWRAMDRAAAKILDVAHRRAALLSQGTRHPRQTRFRGEEQREEQNLKREKKIEGASASGVQSRRESPCPRQIAGKSF